LPSAVAGAVRPGGARRWPSRTPEGVSPPPAAVGLRVHELATLTDAAARQLQGRRLLDRVILDGELDGSRYDCAGHDGAYRSVWLDAGQAGAAERAAQGSGLLVVEATLRRVSHPLLRGADGSSVPALPEYRLVRARGVDRGERRPVARQSEGGKGMNRGYWCGADMESAHGPFLWRACSAQRTPPNPLAPQGRCARCGTPLSLDQRELDGLCRTCLPLPGPTAKDEP
jgi:hypothetical protein